MKNIKVYKIAKYLVESTDYLTTNQLAQKLNVAPKTITNHMDDVDELFAKNNIYLERTRGIGIKIHANPEQIAEFFQVVTSLNVDNEKTDSLDRKIYILDLLLNKNETINVADLEEVLFLSRPSIYKDLDDVTKWLAEHEIKLKRTRKEGISIEAGEKRTRIAIINWYMMTQKYLTEDNAKRGFEYLDPLNLNVLVNQYREFFSNTTIDNVVKDIESEFNMKFVMDEFHRICILLHIALPRYIKGHTVTIRAEVKELLRKNSGVSKLQKLAKIVKKHCNIELYQNELYYLYGIIVMAKTHENEYAYATSIEDAVIKKVSDKVYEYYDIRDKQNFEHELKLHLANVIGKFHLGADFYNPLQSQMESAFPDIYKLAKIVVPIIKSYYNYTIPKDEIAYIALHIASAIERSKQKLNTCFIYNSSYSEARFFMETIQNNVPHINITNFLPHPPSHKIILDEDVDLVLTNTRQKLDCNIKSIALPAILTKDHIISFEKTIIDMYEQVNLKRIKIKDII